MLRKTKDLELDEEPTPTRKVSNLQSLRPMTLSQVPIINKGKTSNKVESSRIF